MVPESDVDSAKAIPQCPTALDGMLGGADMSLLVTHVLHCQHPTSNTCLERKQQMNAKREPDHSRDSDHSGSADAVVRVWWRMIH